MFVTLSPRADRWHMLAHQNKRGSPCAASSGNIEGLGGIFVLPFVTLFNKLQYVFNDLVILDFLNAKRKFIIVYYCAKTVIIYSWWRKVERVRLQHTHTHAHLKTSLLDAESGKHTRAQRTRQKKTKTRRQVRHTWQVRTSLVMSGVSGWMDGRCRAKVNRWAGEPRSLTSTCGAERTALIAAIINAFAGV